MTCAPCSCVFVPINMLYQLILREFLHITLHQDDRDSTRFFWLSDSTNPNGMFDIYRFKTILFGAVSLPFILYATLHYHLQKKPTPTYHMTSYAVCTLTTFLQGVHQRVVLSATITMLDQS